MPISYHYKKAFPRVVPSSTFHDYVPGETVIHVDKSQWNGLGLNVFNLPRQNDGLPAPGIPDYGVTYFFRGGAGKAYQSVLDSGWSRYRVPKNSFQIMNKECNHSWQWMIDDDAESIGVVNLLIDAKAMQNIALESLGTPIIDIEIHNRVAVHDNFMAEIAMRLKAEAEGKTLFGRMFGETAAQLLAMHLLKYYATIHREIPKYGNGLSRCQINIVSEYIDAYLNQDISLETLARLCGLSSYHFARLFKLSTGMPPHQYLVHRRMEKAKQLLRYTQLSVLQIALQVGYQNQSHFSGLFKRCYGLTPRAFRQQQ